MIRSQNSIKQRHKCSKIIFSSTFEKNESYCHDPGVVVRLKWHFYPEGRNSCKKVSKNKKLNWFGINHNSVTQEHTLTNYTFLQNFRILKTDPFMYIITLRIVNTTILDVCKGRVSYTNRGEIKCT